MKRRLTHTIGIAVLAGAVFLVSAALIRSDRAPAPTPATKIAKTAEALYTQAQDAIAQNPRAYRAHAALATAAMQRFRETADAGYYAVAEQAANRALALDPDNFEAIDALATLANSRHRFADAVPLARKSLRLEPDHFMPLGILGDALIELGRYEEGFATVDKRLALRPDPVSYTRASYVAELQGDREHAIALMSQAVDASPPNTESKVWSRAHLALLHLGGGDIAAAQEVLRVAEAERPEDPRVNAALGALAAAKGDLDEAARRYDKSLKLSPAPEYAASLLEVDIARGDKARVATTTALLEKLDDGEEAAGVNIDLDRALIRADLGTPTAADIASARRGRAARPGIVGDQALGWVLTRAGKCDEALTYARRSLRLGTQDALLHFHAGAAARCAGETAQAREWLQTALDINPRFSVRWAPVARRMLSTPAASQ